MSLLLVQNFLAAEEESLSSAAPQMKGVDLQSLATRPYLDHTVVPILLDAMTAVAKERYSLQ